MNKSKKLIVILGPTACGKTRLATRLAVKYNGEIVSADSRQVYCGMDIGTGKDLADYKIGQKHIPYHLIDIVNPMTNFNVARYQKLAYQAIDDVLKRGRQPFLVGGTGLYIDAVIKGYRLESRIKNYESREIRKRLDKLSLSQLLVRLKKIDIKTYNIIDKKNRRRVQRAVEIYYETGGPKSKISKNQKPDYDILILGVKFSLDKIYKKIDKRADEWLKLGLINEVKQLRKKGVTWKRLDSFGLEYRWVAKYLRELIDYDEMMERIKNDIHHFAKRQLTWFKRNKDIKWVKDLSQADREVKKFLRIYLKI